jgi:TrmH family RNA methyltransferase
VDPFSGKVARASAGSIASVPIEFGIELAALIETLRPTHQLVAFDMDGEEVGSIERTLPTVVIFGNEARGLPEEIRGDERIKKISIPMPGGTESLNVASAATIAMYEISRRD